MRVTVQPSGPGRAGQQEAGQQQGRPVPLRRSPRRAIWATGVPSTHSETSTRSATVDDVGHKEVGVVTERVGERGLRRCLLR